MMYELALLALVAYSLAHLLWYLLARYVRGEK